MLFKPLLFGFSGTCSQSILLQRRADKLILNSELEFMVRHPSRNRIKEQVRAEECGDSRISIGLMFRVTEEQLKSPGRIIMMANDYLVPFMCHAPFQMY